MSVNEESLHKVNYFRGGDPKPSPSYCSFLGKNYNNNIYALACDAIHPSHHPASQPLYHIASGIPSAVLSIHSLTQAQQSLLECVALKWELMAYIN